MKYEVIEMFGDMQDSYRTYMPGDIYPRVGYTPTEERIEELSTDKNKRKRPIIKALEEAPKVEPEVKEEPKEEKPKAKPKKKTTKKGE